MFGHQPATWLIFPVPPQGITHMEHAAETQQGEPMLAVKFASSNDCDGHLKQLHNAL